MSDAPPVRAATKTWHPPVSLGKFAMWVFLGTEIMFFTALIGTYIVLRFSQPYWPNPAEILNIPLTAFNTFLLVCSSVTLVLGLNAIQDGNRQKFNLWWLATIIFGAIFVGIQGVEYNQLISEGFVPSTGIVPSTFYIMTCFHGLHVIAGVLINIWIFKRSLAGEFGPDNYAGPEVAGLYWHFVDLVWIILFTLVYLF